MKDFGLAIETYEKTGALRILGYDDFFLIDGKYDISTTMGLVSRLYNEDMKKWFKGWRAAEETAISNTT